MKDTLLTFSPQRKTLTLAVLDNATTRSYFSERNSVSFPESIESEKGWRFDILCMRSPGVKGICADALLYDSLSCQSLRFVVEARYSTEPIQ